MEEGVVNRLLRSQIGPLFDKTFLITDVSGAGNNWSAEAGMPASLADTALEMQHLQEKLKLTEVLEQDLFREFFRS